MKGLKTSLIEALHVESTKKPLELKRTMMGLKFLYKMESNSIYTNFLVTLEKGEDYKYEKTTRPGGVELEPRMPENTCTNIGW